MSQIKDIVNRQREYFYSGETAGISFRLNALKTLEKTIRAHEQEIFEALKKDLNKAPFETYMTEIGIILDEIKYMSKNIKSWCRNKKVKTPLSHFKSTSYIISEPYGVVLVMSPWNYPFQLTIAPLLGAIAGGNCVILKPSEYSVHTSRLLSRIIGESFDERHITVLEGGTEVNRQLLQESFDYIFFTGSASVGRIVMEAAAKQLIPVTLELGGKSPCIVDRDARVDIAARRIIWGKCLNSGQTCVAPDYLYVHREVKKELIEAMKKYITEFYGEDPCNNGEYPRIINERHFNRLRALMDRGTILAGGYVNTGTLQISPTIIDHVTWEDPVMQEEIFGPVLPVLEYDSISEVTAEINRHPKPLALYLFTNNRPVEEEVLRNVSFGGGCVNDTIIHLASSHLPFGGAGASGIGGYHGKWSFDTFTRQKSILKKSTLFDIKLRYAPYGNKLKLLKKIMR